jgi:thioredoxin-dependent peroxiredoxin
MTLAFELKNHNDETVTQDDYLGGGLVMFFYPRAMTTGCTIEACDFRDNYSDLVDAGYNVVGVSPDPPELNAEFREKERLSFDLLSDEDHTLAEELGAWGEKKLYGKTITGLIRSTFVFDSEGNMVGEYRNVKANGHVERVKADLLG